MEEIYNKEKRQMLRMLSFAFMTLGVFSVITFFLFAIDFVPETKVVSKNTSTSTANDTKIGNSKENLATPALIGMVEDELESRIPIRITISTIALDTPIITPSSKDTVVLDNALLSGAVHYPGSGLLSDNANVLLFGHSSYLPVVHNKAFKAFNELGKLKVGDGVTVYSETHKYTYIIKTVLLSKAEDALVQFESETPELTLTTCNTFGQKQDRWVVTATFLSKERL